ncbi:MAG: class I SAM-dependent methyltransferase [Verrucomicrobiales bacterium]|nr:class I SAM-dependent methyltransferase [Verrucomicrobiales bacterium]
MNIANSRFPMTKLVLAFNWHFFLIASFACGIGVLAILFLEPTWLRALLALGVAAGIYFMLASIIASYFIYDHSDLYRLTWWPKRVIPDGAKNAVLIHAGFDPASSILTQKHPELNLQILDFFDPDTTTETSIRTARKLFPPLENETQIQLEAWPLPDQSQDLVFAISAAHEIRDDAQRTTFFREAKRVLRAGGKLIVIEQLRDWRNLLVFGGAVFHFLSYATWLRSFKAGGFTTPEEFWISPWMKAFVLSVPE